MAKSVNRVQLLGNVGRDVEVSFHNGLAIANLSIATSERQKQGDEWKDVTEWHNVVFFGKLADIVREYVSKGAKLYIEGRMRTRSWEAKDGSGKRYKTEVVADELVMLGGKRDQADSRQAPANHDADPITDDDIPF
jgi:single-strand DNA-binding protein